MEIIIKISVFAVIVSILSILLKKNSPDISFMLVIVACSIMIYFVSQLLGNVIDFFKNIAQVSGVPSAVPAVMLKTAGIAIIAKFGADMCRDAGHQSSAAAVEFAGSVVAIYVAIPLMQIMFDMINSFW